jgi:hypothetical protein
MISWLIIVIVVLAGFLFIKMNLLRHRVFIVVVVLLALFVFGTFYYVYSKNNLDLKSFDGFKTSTKVYTGWLVHSFGNVKALTGNAVKMDWSSTEGSLNKKNDSKSDASKVSGKSSVTFKK